MVEFSEIFTDSTKFARKIKKSDYLDSGIYPIIDQGQEFVIGYTNDEKGLYKDVPAIIFGDHTRIIKYIDRPFFIGADGVKVLKTKIDDVDYKYLYYALRNIDIINTGYNRHFKWLKESKIKLPDLKKQQKIATILDSIENIVNLKNIQLQEYDQLIKSRFVEMFFEENSKDKYTLRKWKDVVTIKHGKDYKNNLVESDGYPIYGSGGFMGIYADKYLVEEYSTIIGRKGTIDKPLFVKEKFWNVDTAFGIEVNKDILDPLFFYYRSTFYELKKMSTSTTLPSMTQSALNNIEIGVPPMEIQKQFALFVKQVDKLKFAVQKSLDETQTLFDSLMQQYFG